MPPFDLPVDHTGTDSSSVRGSLCLLLSVLLLRMSPRLPLLLLQVVILGTRATLLRAPVRFKLLIETNKNHNNIRPHYFETKLEPKHSTNRRWILTNLEKHMILRWIFRKFSIHIKYKDLGTQSNSTSIYLLNCLKNKCTILVLNIQLKYVNIS